VDHLRFETETNPAPNEWVEKQTEPTNLTRSMLEKPIPGASLPSNVPPQPVVNRHFPAFPERRPSACGRRRLPREKENGRRI
jgi:hypothetical protein